jgi:ABC-2 type transport system permease protein
MFRVARLVVLFALRRSLNRIAALRRRPKKPQLERSGTARKQSNGGFLMVVFGALFLFSGISQATRAVYSVALLAERRDPNNLSLVDRDTLEALEFAENQARLSPDEQSPDWHELLVHSLQQQAEHEGPHDSAERKRRTERRLQLFDERGSEAFHGSELRRSTLPSTDTWYGPRDSSEMLAPLGLVALMLSVSMALLGVAGTNQDLAKVEWILEWWFTFPVPARGLLLARVLETAFANALGWFVLAPFFTVVFWCAGLGWLSLPLGLFSMLYVGLLAGSLRVVAETALRRWVSLRNVARVQAVLSVICMLPLVAALATSSPEWLEKLARFARGLPDWVLVNALTPVAIAAGGKQAAVTTLACACFAGMATLGATSFGGWVLRDGLMTSAGPHQGKRGRSLTPPGAASAPRAGLLGALVRKELWQLTRDRTLLYQTFVLPAVIFGMQFLMNRRFGQVLTSSPEHAAGMAFGLAAFVLSTGACNTLAVEVPVLWIYFTIPKALDRLFLEKAAFWSVLGCLIAIASYGIAASVGHWSPLAGAALFPLVLIGVTLNAFIATGIGILGTQALESDARRRIPTSMAYLYILLASTFAYALYAPSAWAKFAQVVLSALLAYALWQKVRDDAPFLLDPNEKPRPSIAVADGVIAAITFFMLQALLALLFSSQGYAPGASLLLAFTFAGVLACTFTLFSFWRIGVPNLLATVGLRRPQRGVLSGVLTGIAAGFACSLVAKGYLLVVDHFDVLRHLRDETVSLSNEGSTSVAPWFAVLAVFAAPIFEEFIFRGVLFGGLRRSFGALGAAVASALVFGIVHPAIASAPVFVLGLAAALVYERERSLLAPMAAHMTYNALVIGVALSRH